MKYTFFIVIQDVINLRVILKVQYAIAVNGKLVRYISLKAVKIDLREGITSFGVHTPVGQDQERTGGRHYRH